VRNSLVVLLGEWRASVIETTAVGRFANVRKGRSKHEEGYFLDIGIG
jgi:hypothetical protein